jgi:hypothetical protein
VERGKSVVTAERFAQGMTFDLYVAYVGSPGNLAREAGWWLGPTRHDFSGLVRESYERVGLGDAQIAAIRWLTAQPNGPKTLLVISEEWSSDCRRDVPMLARLAEAGGLEMRIFQRDGQKYSREPKADPGESPNADIVNVFLSEKDEQTFQSVPVAVFLTTALEALHRYVDLSQDAAGRGDASGQAGRESRGGLGALHSRLGGASSVAVLPDVGECGGRRDGLGAPRAARRRPGIGVLTGRPRRAQDGAVRAGTRRSPTP